MSTYVSCPPRLVRVSRRATTLAATVAALVILPLVMAVSPAHATTVTLCNQPEWPTNGTRCPYGLPPRHSYTTGRAASAAASGTLYTEWYVAYTDSNAITPKYEFQTQVGNTLYSPMPNNTQWIRGYVYVVTDYSEEPLYNEGSY